MISEKVELRDAVIGVLAGFVVALVFVGAQMCWQPPLAVAYAGIPVLVLMGVRDEVQYCVLLRHFVVTLVVMHVVVSVMMAVFASNTECKVTLGLSGLLEAVALLIVVGTQRDLNPLGV